MKGLPGFDAGASLYPRRNWYSAGMMSGAGTTAVSPQIMQGCGWWVVCCTEHPDRNISDACCRNAWLHNCARS
jgi:hypothetical protein